MRLWSLHPGYLDRQGLVSLWREALLAQKVLQGKTIGYKNHPQLNRFKNGHSIKLIGSYLYGILLDASYRNYNFDFHKIEEPTSPTFYLDSMFITEGQVAYEWIHFLNKVKTRSPELYENIKNLELDAIQIHPLFKKVPGPIADWENPKF